MDQVLGVTMVETRRTDDLRFAVDDDRGLVGGLNAVIWPLSPPFPFLSLGFIFVDAELHFFFFFFGLSLLSLFFLLSLFHSPIASSLH